MIDIDNWYNTKDQNRYYCPSKIFAGQNMFEEAIELATKNDVIAFFYDSYFESSPELEYIKNQLGHKFCILEAVDTKPWAENAVTTAQRLKDNPPQLVLSLGGGSTTDFAKTIIAQLTFGSMNSNNNPQEAPAGEVKKPQFISIVTTAGSGAETSRYSVVYKKNTKEKVVCRSFDLMADWVFLDPRFLQRCPKTVLLHCAFDVCVHYLESLICRYESSRFSRDLSTTGIVTTIEKTKAMILDDNAETIDYTEIMTASTMAGVAISNVRTGHIHEAAGALLELSPLNHGETLFVFFRTFVKDYEEELYPLLRPALIRLSDEGILAEDAGVEEFIQFWEKCFEETGATEKIAGVIRSLPLESSDFHAHIFNRTFDDKVWIEKEGPKGLDSHKISDLIRSSFTLFRMD